jgi:hypothetical protein
MRVETLGKEALINCAKTAMSSKIVGAESEFFSQLVVDAVTSVKTQPRGEICRQCSLRVTFLCDFSVLAFACAVCCACLLQRHDGSLTSSRT